MGDATFEIVQPGVFTTVQDLGRKGYLASGIPPSGAMDHFAFKTGNLLLKNPLGDAALEFTALGATLKVFSDTVVSFTGGVFDVRRNGEPMPLWQAVPLRKGDVLSVGRVKKGWRGYLCVQGGIDVPDVLGSKSTYTMGALGGLRGRALRKEDMIEVRPTQDHPDDILGRKIKDNIVPDLDDAKELRVVLGPQDDYVAEESITAFQNSSYKVSSKANRVGYRFEGPQFSFKGLERAKDAGSDPSNIVDDGNAIGAIQIPGGVEPICLGVDGVSMGGYVKIACLIAADMDRMAQLGIGQSMRFKAVDVDDARDILRAKEAMVSEENIETS